MIEKYRKFQFKMSVGYQLCTYSSTHEVLQERPAVKEIEDHSPWFDSVCFSHVLLNICLDMIFLRPIFTHFVVPFLCSFSNVNHYQRLKKILKPAKSISTEPFFEKRFFSQKSSKIVALDRPHLKNWPMSYSSRSTDPPCFFSTSDLPKRNSSKV